MLELTSRELEKKLIEKYRLEGDLTAFDQLVNDGLRLSISIARKYSGDQTRLTIIGMIGWFKAITKFDIKKLIALQPMLLGG